MKESLRIDNDFLSDRERKNLSILEMIRRKESVTKADISKVTGINIVTVSNYISHYIEKGLVLELGLDESSGGRRPTLIKLNPKAGFVIGVGLNIMDIVGVAVDLESNVLYEMRQDRFSGVTTTTSPLSVENGESTIYSLVEVVSKVLENSKLDVKKLKGIGVGVPGIIDVPGQKIKWPNERGVKDISICIAVKDLFEDKFGVPTIIENDATIAAFGEKWLGLDPTIKNMLYMYAGVGCGIMINGQIYKGSSGIAGEVNIHNPEFECLPEKEQEKLFYLLRWELDMGLSYKAKQAIKEGKESEILALAGGRSEMVTFRTVVKAAKAGDKLAIDLLREAGVNLGIKIAFFVNFLNPEMVVLGGGIEEAGTFIVEPIKETVAKWAFEEAFRIVKIVPSRLGNKAVALGGASGVIQEVFLDV
ncbi:ROK family transcriptional regulator [bacterium]|nr:ROK family transcriptional regulator [bacterium]MBU1852850.1 ROK family transcriptional regulator [Candidatus Omnitrophota bacterium]